MTGIRPSFAASALAALFPLLLLLPAGSRTWAQEVVTTNPLRSAAPDARETIPAAPAAQVLDDAGIFQEAERLQLEKKLAASKKDGFTVYAATFTYIYGEDANQRAVRLAEKWLNGTNGAVLVFDKGGDGKSFSLGIACAQEDSRPFSTEMLLEVAHRAAAAAKDAKTPKEQVTAGTVALVAELAKLKPLLSESQRLLSATQWKIAGMVIGAMVLCLLLLFALQRFQKSADRRAGDVLLFPEIEVAQRYGATFGGGVVVQMEFANCSVPEKS